ncbi:MAG: phosphatidate cytidylyltransferase [Chlamydiota bacterium]|jgi:phosphatidate cytidylyltransferase
MKKRNMADLKKRIGASCVVGIVVALLIAFSTSSFVSFLLMLFVALLAAIGVWEYAKLCRNKGIVPADRWMMALAVCQVVALYASLVFVDFPQFPVLVLFAAMVLFFLLHFKDSTGALCTIAVEFFAIAYIAAPLSLMLGILYPIDHLGVPQEGRWWLVYLIFVTKITDIGAYFVGRLFGRRQLCALLSPKKTVEGALAGFISALLGSIAVQQSGVFFFGAEFSLSLIEAIWLGMLIGVFGQIGDLAESLLKRDAVVKDSNRLPGFGGVLDMLDSLLFTAPILYFFIRMH